MTARHGILVLDKPAGITSRDAVDLACSRLRSREIGHCGTLDPLATGVLVLVVGKARRLQERLSRSRKVYRATIRLGAVSETDDAEGPITETEPTPTPPSAEAIEKAVQSFRGEIEQRPPRYSAVKIEGKRLYDLARQGKDVEAPTRKVVVYDIRLLRYEWPTVELEIACAGGTYVRSIARDMGESLATGGYLESLCRTGSGGFTLERAVKPEALTADDLLSLEEALAEFPRLDIAASQAKRLANGADVRVHLPMLSLDEEQSLFGWVNGRVVAQLKKEGPGKVRSQRMLVTPEELIRFAEEELEAEDRAAEASRGHGGGRA